MGSKTIIPTTKQTMPSSPEFRINPYFNESKPKSKSEDADSQVSVTITLVDMNGSLLHVQKPEEKKNDRELPKHIRTYPFKLKSLASERPSEPMSNFEIKSLAMSHLLNEIDSIASKLQDFFPTDRIDDDSNSSFYSTAYSSPTNSICEKYEPLNDISDQITGKLLRYKTEISKSKPQAFANPIGNFNSLADIKALKENLKARKRKSKLFDVQVTDLCGNTSSNRVMLRQPIISESDMVNPEENNKIEIRLTNQDLSSSTTWETGVSCSDCYDLTPRPKNEIVVEEFYRYHELIQNLQEFNELLLNDDIGVETDSLVVIHMYTQTSSTAKENLLCDGDSAKGGARKSDSTKKVVNQKNDVTLYQKYTRGKLRLAKLIKDQAEANRKISDMERERCNLLAKLEELQCNIKNTDSVSLVCTCPVMTFSETVKPAPPPPVNQRTLASYKKACEEMTEQLKLKDVEIIKLNSRISKLDSIANHRNKLLKRSKIYLAKAESAQMEEMNKNKELQQEINGLNDLINTQKKSLDSYKKQVATLQEENSSLQTVMKNKMAEEKRIPELEEALTRKTSEVDKFIEETSNRIQAMREKIRAQFALVSNKVLHGENKIQQYHLAVQAFLKKLHTSKVVEAPFTKASKQSFLKYYDKKQTKESSASDQVEKIFEEANDHVLKNWMAEYSKLVKTPEFASELANYLYHVTVAVGMFSDSSL